VTDNIECRLHVTRPAFAVDVDLQLPAQGITAIYGPSGSGKTTLLRAMAGLEPSRGYFRFAESIWQDQQLFVPAHRRAIGLVFQDSALFDHLTVRGNLHYGHDRTPSEQRRLSVGQAAGLMGLNDLLNRKPQHLSGGERKRVAIARALARNPRLLLLDEPTASLDEKHKRELLPFLERLHEELQIPAIYVSHVPGEIARLADHLVLMDNGRITANGTVNELLTRFDLPLAHDTDAAAIIEGTPVEHDSEYDLTRVAFAGGELFVQGPVPQGPRVRIRILARDVSLTLQQPTATSILNILPATVLETNQEDDARVLVRLDTGDGVLLAGITRKSAELLHIAPGQQLYAQVKTLSLLNA